MTQKVVNLGCQLHLMILLNEHDWLRIQAHKHKPKAYDKPYLHWIQKKTLHLVSINFTFRYS